MDAATELFEGYATYVSADEAAGLTIPDHELQVTPTAVITTLSLHC
ncbi:hypothetical protein ACFV0B_33330 [Streptomyces xanthophaeus]